MMQMLLSTSTVIPENIDELFQPGKEVLTYCSNKKLLEIIQEMLSRKEEIEQISKAEQNRT